MINIIIIIYHWDRFYPMYLRITPNRIQLDVFGIKIKNRRINNRMMQNQKLTTEQTKGHMTNIIITNSNNFRNELG